MSLLHSLRQQVWKLGYDVCRISPATHAFERRRRLMETFCIDLVIDVGANTGGFALELRRQSRYGGRIESFEPLRTAFDEAKRQADGDSNWNVHHCALGDADTEQEINVAGNSTSSSLLPMLPLHVEKAPQSAYIGKEAITVRRLDDMFEQLRGASQNVYLKIDTQGFEAHVLRGAEGSLAAIGTVQLEMSLRPLYAGETGFQELGAMLFARGYSLVSVEPGFVDLVTGQVMQVDGIFHRF